jgi:prevent-host-death family protein
MNVSIREAKTYFSKLLAKVEQGEQITITRHSKAIARLVSVEPVRQHDVRGIIAEMKALAKGRHADMPIKDMIARRRG